MNFSRILFLTVILSLLSQVAAADSLITPTSTPSEIISRNQVPPSSPRTPTSLTLGDALARTAELNPELVALGFGGEVTDGRIAQAGMAPNPSLSLSVENFGGTGIMRGSEVMEVTVQASQLIERGDKAGRRIVFAERERDIAHASLVLRRSDILAASANAFANALAEIKRLSLTEEQLKLTKETFDLASRRLEAAIGSPSEVARARAALASAQADFARAQANCTIALSVLAASWGGSAADIAEIKGALSLPASPPPLARFVTALSLSGNPRLGLLSSVVASQRAALDLETARGAADVTLGVGVRRLNEGSSTAFVVGASIPLTFRDDNSGNIRAARAMVRVAEQSLRAAEVEQRTALVAVHAELLAVHAQATAIRREALPAAEEACISVQYAYDNGTLAFIDVLDARRALITLRHDLLEAELAYALVLARAETIAGTSFAEMKALIK
jgi:cobalt-zinc-cadmium efflux system outer membrane protein